MVDRTEGNEELVSRAALRDKRSPSELAGKYLTFNLADEEYGIEILKVKEIIRLMDITQIPRMPDCVRGVINLRGRIVPVVDLRVKFSLESRIGNGRTCIIVVEITENGRSRTTGILADSVSEVVDIGKDQIEKTLSFGTDVDTEFIMGIARIGSDVKILLDVTKALS